MKKSTYLAAALCLPLLNGCIVVKSNEYVEYVQIDGSQTFTTELDADTTVFLDLPSGKINILESTEGQSFTAHLSRSCPVNQLAQCREELEGIEFVAKRKNGRYTLTTNKSNVFNSDGKFTLDIHVPDIHHLELEVTAGEINVSPLRSCLTADVTAGDLNINAYSDEVKSVSLHATAGDTSLRVNGRGIPEKRFLMRSKTSWFGGEGACDLKAEVSAGEVSVNVVEG